MAILKKSIFDSNLQKYQVLVQDTDPNSRYFRITELPETFTGGKNAFLIQGSVELVPDTIVKIEIKDAKGKVVYHEPGRGIPEYYEGTSKVVSVYIYPDTAFGPCTITILGELSEYEENGVLIPVPSDWRGKYNVKWKTTVNINPLLPNTTKIRFYKRPRIAVTESVLPVYTRTVTEKTISGSINGTAVYPTAGNDYKTFKGVLRYELSMNGNAQFSQSMEGVTFTINGLNNSYEPVITDVITNKRANVNVPYYEVPTAAPNYQEIKSFTSASFTASFNESVVYSESSVNSSFARLKITDLETFSGDAYRLKVFAKSRNSIGDFELLQDIQLESNELLQAETFGDQINIRTGLFTQPILDSFWLGTAIGTTYTASIDNSLLFQSVKLKPTTDTGTDTALFKFYNSASIDFTEGTEYQLDFTPLLSSSVGFAKIEVYASGSSFLNTDITTTYGKLITSIDTTKSFIRYDKQQINFKADSTGTGNIVFLVKSGVWQIANVSLTAAQESSFSPNEVTLVANVPTKINDETFDFRIEVYDINNNYVPVRIEDTYTFVGSNIVIPSIRDLQVNPIGNSFSFSTGSIFPSSIYIDYFTTGLTGSVSFASSAVDTNGSTITVGDLNVGASYPGLLTTFDADTKELTVGNFTGSLISKTVGAITYTVTCEDLSRYFTIYRIGQGASGTNASGLRISADANQFFYKMTDLTPYPSDQTISILATRQNLGDPSSSITITKVGSGPNPSFISTSFGVSLYKLSTAGSGSGVTTYTIGNFDINTPNVIISDSNSYNVQIASFDTETQIMRMIYGSSTYSVDVESLDLESGALITKRVLPFLGGYSYDNGITTYTFTSYDLESNAYYDRVTISPIVVESQISVNLTNDNTTLPAYSTGFIPSASFALTSGSVSVLVSDEQILRSEGLLVSNSFDIISATPTNCVANDETPDDVTYGIKALTSDSASLNLLIRYKDGRGIQTDITKLVTYSKAKKAAPVLSLVVSNNNQSVDAKSTGEQITSFATSSLSVVEAYDGVSTTKTLNSAPTIVATNGYTNYTATATEITFGPLANSIITSSALLFITGAVTDSENVTRNVYGTVSLAKINRASPVLSIEASPINQNVPAKSTGEQSGSFSDSVITVRQTVNNATTILSLTALSASSQDLPSLTTDNNTGKVLIGGQTLGNDTDYTIIYVTASVVDSDTSARDLYTTLSLSKTRKAAPVIAITIRRNNQQLPAFSTGVQSGSFSDCEVIITETYNGITRILSSSVTASVSGNIFENDQNINIY